MLRLNGHDLRDMPLENRREVLREIIPEAGRIQFSHALPGLGRAATWLAFETAPWSDRIRANCRTDERQDMR